MCVCCEYCAQISHFLKQRRKLLFQQSILKQIISKRMFPWNVYAKTSEWGTNKNVGYFFKHEDKLEKIFWDLPFSTSILKVPMWRPRGSRYNYCNPAQFYELAMSYNNLLLCFDLYTGEWHLPIWLGLDSLMFEKVCLSNLMDIINEVAKLRKLILYGWAGN